MAYQYPLNGGRINASIGGNSTSAGAGYSLISTGTMLLAGGNNVTLSQNANSISINAGGGGTMSMYALGNTTQNSSATMDVRSVSLNGLGALTAGYSNGSIQLSAPVVSSLSATGAVSISNNAGTISIGAPAFSAGMSNIGNTSGTSGTASNQVIFAGGNNVTLSQSTGAGGNTLTISAANQSNQNMSLYARGNTTQNSSTLLNASNLSFNGLGAATMGYSNGSIQVSVPTQTNQTANFYVSSNTTQLSSTAGIDLRSVSFQGAGIASVGVSQGKVLISVPSGGAGGVALANSQATFTSGTVNLLEGGGAVTIASSAGGQSFKISVPTVSSVSATGALSISANGNTVSMGVPAVSMGMSNIGNTSGTSGTASNQLVFAGGNNVTLSQSTGAGGNTITVSAANQSNQTANFYVSSNSTQLSSTAGIDLRSITYQGAGAASVGLSQGKVLVSVPTQTNQSLGLYGVGNTTGQSSSSTFDARTLSFQGAGAASVGYSNGSVVISAPNAAAGNVTISAGGNSAGLASIVFSNSNGVSFGLNGSTITASAAGGAGGGIALANSQTTYTSGTANLLEGGGAITIASTTGQKYNFSVPATSSLVGISPVSLSTNGSTISISVNSTTFNSTVLGRGNNAWLSNSTSLGQNTLYIFPEVIQQYVSGSVVKIPVLVTNSSSGFAAHTRGHTVNFGVYSRHATNSTVLTQMYSTSYTAAISASSNASWGISLITGLGNSTSYNTVTASSAGLNLSASVHGPRELLIGFATQLSPGEYWFGIQNSSSSAGAAGNLFQMSYPVMSATAITGNAFGMSTNTGSRGIYQNMGQGVYSVTTGALPAGISMTQINQSAINPLLYFMNVTA